MAEQIKVLFGMNTFGGPRNIVFDWGPDPLQQGEVDSMQPLPNYFGLLLKFKMWRAGGCCSFQLLLSALLDLFFRSP